MNSVPKLQMEAKDFAFMQGHWHGQGKVMLADKEVLYEENLNIDLMRTEPCHMFNWQQYTKHAVNGNKMHAENGFLKIFGNGKAQASFSHPFDLNEFEFGSVEGHQLTLEATQDQHFQRAQEPTEDKKAKMVTYLKRVYTRKGDTLECDTWLGVAGGEPKHHLHSVLEKKH